MLQALVLSLVLGANPALPPEYAALHAKAIAEQRTLIVWVGVARPDVEAARPDAFHLHCANFPEAAAPCVVVSRPGNGNLWRIVDLPAAQADRLRPTWRRVCGPSGCTFSHVPEY